MIEEKTLKKIVLAIIENELKAYKSELNKRNKSKSWHEAKAWIFSEKQFGISFEDCCAVLGYNGDYIRRLLRRCEAQK